MESNESPKREFLVWVPGAVQPEPVPEPWRSKGYRCIAFVVNGCRLEVLAAPRAFNETLGLLALAVDHFLRPTEIYASYGRDGRGKSLLAWFDVADCFDALGDPWNPAEALAAMPIPESKPLTPAIQMALIGAAIWLPGFAYVGFQADRELL